MTPSSEVQTHHHPGIASAEDGFVILDGPDGMAVTLSPAAAAQTGHSLIAAAALAEEQAKPEVKASDMLRHNL